MDYRALAGLVMMALFGLSTLVVAMGFSVKFFLAPVLKDLFPPRQAPGGLTPGAADTRLANIEDRLDAIERGLRQLTEAERFDRQLGRLEEE
jgi:hypothetical protein